MSEALKILLLSIALAACGAASPSEGSDRARASFHPRDRASAEENLLGVGESAFPELAPVWTAIASHPAHQVSEGANVGDSVEHCLSITVVGDLVPGARRSWERGFEEAGARCTPTDRGLRCASERLPPLDIGLQLADEPSALDAVAAEMAIATQPVIALNTCTSELPFSRIASIEERLHAAGLLEPWREIHERVGADRLLRLDWIRSVDLGDEVLVAYRADEEAFALVEDWAQREGLSGVSGTWVRTQGGLTVAINLDRSGPQIRLSITRER